MTGSRIRRGQLPRLFLAFGLLLAAATMAVAFAATSVGGGRPQRLLEANAAMDSLLLRQAVVVEGRQPADLATFDRLSRDFDDALSRGGDATRAGSTDRALLTEQAMLADRWRSSAARSLLAPREQRARDVEERARLLDGFSARNAALAQRASSAQAARNRTRRLVLLFTAIGFVALLALAGAFTALRGWRRHAARVDEDKRLLLEDRRQRAAQEEFGRALQGTRTQREAQRMLKRYLERGLPSSLATVLDRDNADNRLEAVTGLRPDSPLASTLENAEPDDCLAVRFGRAHQPEAGADPLLPCKLCGTLECAVTCVPSLVGARSSARCSSRRRAPWTRMAAGAWRTPSRMPRPCSRACATCGWPRRAPRPMPSLAWPTVARPRRRSGSWWPAPTAPRRAAR